MAGKEKRQETPSIRKRKSNDEKSRSEENKRQKSKGEGKIMADLVEINYEGIEQNIEYEKIIKQVLTTCFKEENMDKLGLYVSVTLTCPSYIKKINNEYRNIDKETDVLSFPIFEKYEIDDIIEKQKNMLSDVIGDIIISVDRVKEQAVEYNHSFERELAYMVVHGFYHLMGYDHITEEDKKVMRLKEENILNKLSITRD